MKAYLVFQVATTEEELPIFLDLFFKRETAEYFIAKYDTDQKFFIETYQETGNGYSEVIGNI